MSACESEVSFENDPSQRLSVTAGYAERFGATEPSMNYDESFRICVIKLCRRCYACTNDVRDFGQQSRGEIGGHFVRQPSF